MNPFNRWWQLATPEDKDRLAKLAGTTKLQLGQLSGGRMCSPALARRIEIGTVQIATTKKLPIVLRSDLASVCHRCEYARTCEKRAVRSVTTIKKN